MIGYVVVPAVALAASLLTFFSGFGLGTLLLPAMALFFPVTAAVAATAIVHMANNLAKGALLVRDASWPVALAFGVPAMAASWLGAKALVALAGMAPLWTWEALGHAFTITPVKAVVGAVLVAFAFLEVIPVLGRISYSPPWLPIGGALSGFFGGLSGFQGAFRSAVLVKAGLEKRAFLGTGVAIALAVDFVRLLTYGLAGRSAFGQLFTDPGQVTLVWLAIGAALAGTLAGGRMLEKVTMPGIQRFVTITLVVFGGLLSAGIL